MTTQEYLGLIDKVNENGKYKADWHSLSHHASHQRTVHTRLHMTRRVRPSLPRVTASRARLWR